MENSSGIGRVYKLNWRGWAFPLLCLAVGSADAVASLTGVPFENHHRQLVGAVSSVILLVGGIVLAARALKTKVILSNDAIEVCSIFSNKRLLFNEIRGRRESVQRGLTGLTTYWELEPKNENARSIEVSTCFTLDDVFCEWFDQIPDLDAEDVN